MRFGQVRFGSVRSGPVRSGGVWFGWVRQGEGEAIFISTGEIMKAERWPLDISRLSKGSKISAENCEEIIGESREGKNYGLKLVGLCDAIMKLAENEGRALPCRIVQDAIEIMDDETAAKYYASQFINGVRQCARAHRRQTRYVDRAQLCAESQSKYDRSVALQAMVQSSTRGVIRQFSRQIEHKEEK